MTDAEKHLCVASLCLIEGVKLQAYQDKGGVWTIGVGHTKNVVEGQFITMAQTMAYLQDDLAPLFALLNGKPWKTTQLLAYVDFGFNVGINALKRVLANEDQISNPIHTRVHGLPVQGLIERRNWELALLAC